MGGLLRRSERIFKIVLLGDGGVGKTSLRNRFLGKGFRSSYSATMGTDFSLYKTKVNHNGKQINIKLQIWDLAGQRRFKTVRAGFYKGTLGALMIFDSTRPKSAEHMIEWANELRANTDKSVIMVLAGNKIDLRNQYPEAMSSIDGERIASQISKGGSNKRIAYFETSAKDNTNVPKAFNELVISILKRLSS